MSVFSWCRFAALGVTAVLAAGCGSSSRSNVARPFAVPVGGGIGLSQQVASWGDGESGPDGSVISCVNGRHLVIWIEVRNQTKHTVTLTGSPPVKIDPSVERVAVRFELEPHEPAFVDAQPTTDWSRRGASPVAVPAGRRAWVLSSLLMSHCSVRQGYTRPVANGITLHYRAGTGEGSELIDSRRARILLFGGPKHPNPPVNSPVG